MKAPAMKRRGSRSMRNLCNFMRKMEMMSEHKKLEI
jgi:hypothetical protein